MTTLLRFVGASIMGILDPIPAAPPSPMSDEEGTWVRANAWTKALRSIDAAYPHGFHRWCSCERGTCHPCRSGHHDQCVSANGPRVDEDAGTMTDRGGFVIAVIRYRSGERPCRWICPCTHPTGGERQPDATEDSEVQPVGRRAQPGEVAASGPGGQLSLFAASAPAEGPAHGETP
jgi:hypothetical protein